MLIALFSLYGCGGSGGNIPLDMAEAVERLELSLELMRVYTFTESGRLTSQENFTWRNYRTQAFHHDKIVIDVDFKHILNEANVQHGDFDRARIIDFDFNKRLQEELDIAFHFTCHLKIRISNTAYLMDNFHNIEYIVDLSSLSLRLDRFLMSDSRVITVVNCDGGFEMHSDFILGRPVRTSEATSSPQRIINPEDQLYLVFEYDSPAIQLRLWDAEYYCRTNGPLGEPLDIENAGRSVHMKIPLSFDESAGSGSAPLFHAVYYTDPISSNRAILPRSFVNGEYMHIFFNRLGTFELTSTKHGVTDNFTEFLYDRGIRFGDRDYATRGEFYSNLMLIHWAEGLHFLLNDDRPAFPDILDISVSDRVHIGRNLMVDIENGTGPNFILDGHTDGDFRPDRPLRRRHLYMLLAGNISYFNFEVDGLKPGCQYAVICPSYDLYWQYRFMFLRDIGFVPYARDEYEVAHIAPVDYIAVCEAEHILFILILGGDQYRYWRDKR